MKIYQVGGAVRDKLLGLPATDHDWVVVGSSPAELESLGYKPIGKDFPVFLHPKLNFMPPGLVLFWVWLPSIEIRWLSSVMICWQSRQRNFLPVPLSTDWSDSFVTSSRLVDVASNQYQGITRSISLNLNEHSEAEQC